MEKSKSNPSSNADDFYVLPTKLLDESRDPPKQTSLFERIVRTPSFSIGAMVAYLLLMIANWGSIRPLLGFVPEGILFGVIATIPFAVVMSINAVSRQARTGIPAYRDLITIQDFIQAVFAVVLFATLATLIFNLQNNLSTSGLNINFGVLARNFGTEVSEGPDPRADLNFLQSIPLVGESIYNLPIMQPDTNFRALAVGFANTIRVVWLSLIASTIVGVLLGVGLLSNNWLVRNVSGGYVEIFRNTPLLVQLFFVYNGVIRLLPARPSDAISLPGPVYISSRGLYYPALIETPTSGYFYWMLAAGVVVGIGLWRWRLGVNERTGQPAWGSSYFMGSVLGFGVVGFIIAMLAGANPIAFDPPTASRFNFSGGTGFSGEYLGLFLGLSLYTSAFIADIVRAGIQAVPKGQIEAARALGLKNFQTLNQIILPQALRLAVPPLTNQYLNLAKNSSLGIAIGFTDLYTVATISNNQTGQTVALFVILMVTYLALSLFISLIMNLFNASIRIRTR